MRKDAAAVKSRSFCWLAPAAFALDRAAKAWASTALGEGRTVVLWPRVLRLRYIENTGAAFGLLQGRTVLLAVVTGAVLAGLLVWLLLYGRSIPALPQAALWLLLGGAAGNLFDRILYGYVVDFIELLLFRFPIFNIADICVCAAFILLLGWLIPGRDRKPNAR